MRTRLLAPSATLLTALVFALTACNRPAASSASVLTQATLDSLPTLQVSEGRLLCVADGRVPCPLLSAYANWLSDESFAVWEPGHPVMVWRGTDTAAVLLGNTDSDEHGPVAALAVASDGSGYQMLVSGATEELLQFGRDGKVTKRTELPRINGVFSRGFSGDVPLLQRMLGAAGDNQVHFELDALKSPMDTSGRPLFRQMLSWLRMGTREHQELAPLFPAWPSFGIDRDGGIVWSPSDRFVIHRLNRSGSEQWTINGNFEGPSISAADIAARRAEVLKPGGVESLTPEQFDSMVARTSKTLPAIGGIAVSRAMDILVTASPSPSRDSVTCYRIDPSGKLVGQFRLPARTRVMLFAGDSMLVHRPTEGEPWEVRWLQVKAAH